MASRTKKTANAKPNQDVPEVLRTPIELTVMQLMAETLAVVDETSAAARQEVAEQFMARYRALFEYFGISPDTPEAKDRLILMMGSELFPNGFRRVLKERRTGVKETCWTVRTRLELLETMESLLSGGMTIDAAAQHIRDHKLLPKGVSVNQDVGSITTRYHEARNLANRLANKHATPLEEFELLALHYLGREIPDPGKV